ncbi:hypothetical protein E2542_SST23950 [Spatholobus suberectus]|nr:hypothetical protein E2542_SST23950 [Spatholobus suberectus]
MEKGGSNCSKKRKICREEDEDDEAKMETFFALVRNIRETRDRWIGLRSGDGDHKRGKVMRGKEENRAGVWKPAFQVEDFADEQARRPNSDPSSALLAGASQSAKEEDAEKGIDLKLSL